MRPLRVLVVDDTPANLMLASALVERLGFTADTAADGPSAIAASLARPYALVLMDIMMPEMDGLEATRRIRASEEGQARLPIVALTAADSESDRARASEAGMDDFLAKPLRSAQLRDVLARWTAVLDPAQVKDLMDTLGAESWRQLLAEYHKVLAEGLPRLREADARSDAEAVRALSHSLRGTSANLGAESLRRLFTWLEWRARHGACLVSVAWPAIEGEAADALRALDAVVVP